MNNSQHIDRTTVAAWLDDMAAKLRSQLSSTPLPEVGMIGIHRHGVDVAHALHSRLGLSLPLATLDISFYRDDYSQIGLHSQVQASSIPFDIDERTLILVDDVLHTGRTIRAALNTLFDYGRPQRVLLAALVERPGHQLPIRADACGQQLSLSSQQWLQLQAHDLSIDITTKTDSSTHA